MANTTQPASAAVPGPTSRKEARFGRGARAVAAVLLTLAGGAFAIPSCSLIIDGSPIQCTANADCKGIAGTVCSSDGVCVSADECTTNADCSAMGDYYVCRQLSPRKCVQLVSDDCPTVVGDYTDDSAVFVGLIADLGGDTGASILNGATLGVNDFNTLGVPPKPGTKNYRPMVLVACSDQSSNTTGVSVAQHMVDDLGLTAICGAAFSGITLDIATKVTIPAGVLLMSSSATSTQITGLADHDPTCVDNCGSDATCAKNCVGLVWRTSPSDTFQGAAVIEYFKSSYEKEIRADISDPAFTGDLKVAIVFKGDTYGTGLKKTVEDGLVFNGMPALSQNSTTYQTFNYGNPDDPKSSPVNYNQAVVGLTNFAPDIILAFGTDEIVHEIDPDKPTGAGIFDRVEAGWTGASKPHWIFSDGGLIDPLSASAQKADALGRVRGTVPGTNNVNFQSFVSEYNSQFSTKTLGSAQTFGAAGAYDIMFLFGYSASAALGNPLTGAQYATGFARMVGGDTLVKVGAGADLNAGEALMTSADGKMNIDGASGPLDFDLTLGEAPSDIQIWCLPKPDSKGKVGSGAPSGVQYSGTTQKITGTISATNCSSD